VEEEEVEEEEEEERKRRTGEGGLTFELIVNQEFTGSLD